jgi:hypothetical protein
MTKERRTYKPRIVGDKVMMPTDLKRLHKYMLDVEHIGIISDEMREVVEELWPELAHKLPPDARVVIERAIAATRPSPSRLDLRDAAMWARRRYNSLTARSAL